MNPHPSRIAIVDDDLAVLDSTRMLLEVAGHRVATFASPCEFLEQTTNDFDCLILDHHMPQLTGLELARQLRTAGVRMPIMLVTGSLTPEISAGAARMHLEKVLEKPASEAELMKFVATAA